MDFGVAETVSVTNPIAGDLALDATGQPVVVEATEAIAQDIRTRLRWFKGEWFLDARTGFPWFQRVLGQKVTERVVELLLRRAILGTPGVSRLASMRVSIDRRSREFTATFSAVAVDGQVIDFSDFVLGDVVEGA